MEPDRARYGLLEAGVSIVGNIVLFILKLSVGIYISSISVIADAFHTFSDLLSSAMVWVGFKIGSKAPDRKHPHGHGRMETIVTLAIAVLLLMTGLTRWISHGMAWAIRMGRVRACTSHGRTLRVTERSGGSPSVAWRLPGRLTLEFRTQTFSGIKR